MSEAGVTGWNLSKGGGDGGTGNWRVLKRPWDDMLKAAESWKKEIADVEKPWLCWNMNDRWCLLQQKLILETGWTPIVGWDPNCSNRPAKLAPGAIAIDFNKDLKLPVLFPHVPIELAFIWAQRLGFWHADMLLTREKMKTASKLFESLKDGEMAAVYSFGGLRNILKYRNHRYWEVLGCTTRNASLDQYKNGCGWWREWTYHVNAPTDEVEKRRRAGYYNDHGTGVMYWKRHCNGQVRAIPEKFIRDGHFSITSVNNYVKGESKSEEMDINFDLEEICQRFQIADLLEP